MIAMTVSWCIADVNNRPVWIQEVMYTSSPVVWRVCSDISVTDQLWPDWHWDYCTRR